MAVMLDQTDVKTTVFTDGASKRNPGPGGWAYVMVIKATGQSDEVTEGGGAASHATNNQMELTAVIEALEAALTSKKGLILSLFSDSSYVLNGAQKWLAGWKKKGWITTAKKEVENRDLWEALDARVEALEDAGVKIDWQYVGGHIGVVGNERCDVIATAFAEGAKPTLYRGSISGYSIKNILDIGHDDDKKTSKSSGKSHSRAIAYSYVSEVGGVVQVHKTWAECEARVKGRPARFKKALSAEDEAILIKSFSNL